MFLSVCLSVSLSVCLYLSLSLSLSLSRDEKRRGLPRWSSSSSFFFITHGLELSDTKGVTSLVLMGLILSPLTVGPHAYVYSRALGGRGFL